MSVATKNPFAILDAEDTSRPSSPPPPKKQSSQSAPARASQKPRGGPASRVGGYYPRGGARQSPRDTNQTQNGVDDPAPEPRKFEGGRGRGRGRGGDRPPPRGGRRPFDRHSQTGKTDSDKKIHQAWGGDDGKQELKAEEAANVDAAAEGANWGTEGAQADWGAGDTAPTDIAGATAEDDKTENKPRREKEEEEDNTLTLEQYLAKQRGMEPIVPKLDNTRKANEGADANIWKDVVQITKNDTTDNYFVGKAKTAPKTRSKKEEKVFIEIDARFDRPDRGGRGRGRGERGRGGRGRGGARGGRQNGSPTQTINVDDQTAFPSLS
ncbi:hypothetical protein AMATHDRAFT_44375 [Amanita thiersii Skay4041]|uniref:Hyaluronan/mRNA-binding protein domain-containing protein n=1 Tax=Amanita thiersii Skay4041 TaxID=703135 RepID=A0A2A9P1C7_9AGAR|nr:hypothetical protein AMATHDRAFT_44375 [Amanita thiersii Skay4041]